LHFKKKNVFLRKEKKMEKTVLWLNNTVLQIPNRTAIFSKCWRGGWWGKTRKEREPRRRGLIEVYQSNILKVNT